MSILWTWRQRTTTTNLAASNSAVVVGSTGPSHLIIIPFGQKAKKGKFICLVAAQHGHGCRQNDTDFLPEVILPGGIIV